LCGNGQSLFALKDAMVRNIKEYNDKFKARKLNPENGHRFYRTLVVDE
jgi:S-DNA-T family DNA segregation ATPase FtsK/SpoIIIE